MLKKYSLDLYSRMLYRLLLVMAIFTLTRIGFYLINQEYFPDMRFGKFLYILFGGLRFDLVAILYTNTIFVLMCLIPFHFRYNLTYQKVTKILFLITNGIIIAINFIDLIYFRFTARRTTTTIFKEFEHETNLPGLFSKFLIDYWYVVIPCLIFIYLLIKSYGKSLNRPELAEAKVYYPVNVVIMAVSILLFIAGIRGGYENSSRPITLSNAGQYIEKPLEISIVLNTPFTIFKTLGKSHVSKQSYFKTEAELNAEFTPVHKGMPKGSFQPQNVVVIIVESLGKEYIGSLNPDLDGGKYKGFAPFLDSLIGQSKTFHYSFANGKKSIDAMPSVLASIPSMVEPFVLSPFCGDKLNTLPNLLKRKGYTTGFFHGAPNGSMGFQAFANMCGFDKYYGKTEYGHDEDFDGLWGIWDEEFLQFFAKQMNQMKSPFFTSLFTVTSHHPYIIPERYQGKFPEGNLRIHKNIGYTDMALKKFFATASKMPWFKNTLFVLTADHTNADSYYPVYHTNAGLFSIPIIFYKPGSDLKGQEERLVQQNDIMPTILSYLNYDEDYVAFGHNAFDATKENFVVNYNDGYQIFLGDYLLQYNGEKTTGLYKYKTDKFLTTNLLGSVPEVETKLERKLKAFIQQYNNRLVDDKLVASQP